MIISHYKNIGHAEKIVIHIPKLRLINFWFYYIFVTI